MLQQLLLLFIMALPIIGQIILMGHKLAKRINLKFLTITVMMMALTILTTIMAIQIHLATIDHTKIHYGPPDIGSEFALLGLFLGIILTPFLGLIGNMIWYFINQKPEPDPRPYQNY